MSNTYDIELKMDICSYSYKPKKEKLKEIRTNKKEFKVWADKTLDKFDDVADRMDEWMDKPNDMVSKDTNEVWSIDKGKWISID